MKETGVDAFLWPCIAVSAKQAQPQAAFVRVIDMTVQNERIDAVKGGDPAIGIAVGDGLNGLPISAVGGVEALFAEDDPSAPALVEEIVFSEVFGQDFEVLESDPGPSGVRNRSDPRNSEPFRACHG